MCNDYRQEIDLASIEEDFADLKINISYPEGRPNLEPRADIKITDTAPIVRIAAGDGGELVQRRWSWPSRGGGPVFTFKSEDREFGASRCLVPADGFYEFTTPDDKAKKLKNKWLFTWEGQRFLEASCHARLHPPRFARRCWLRRGERDLRTFSDESPAGLTPIMEKIAHCGTIDRATGPRREDSRRPPSLTARA